MREYILLMHGDTVKPASASQWHRYFETLRQSGHFDGGSAMGEARAYRKDVPSHLASSALTGFVRIRAQDFSAAEQFLEGNPVFENGGTVEIRELPRD